MTPEAVFSICSTAVLPGWLLLAFAPRWKWTHRLVPTAFAVPLALVYAFMLASNWGETKGDFQTLAGVKALFSNSEVLVGGWIHYLVFDLFVGAWQVRDAQRLHLPHLAVVPCLLLTLMFGPVGLFLYWLVRTTLRRRWILTEEAQ